MLNDKKIKFTPVLEAAKEFPPQLMKKQVPEWYRNMPLLMDGCEESGRFLSATPSDRTIHTIKKCVPVMDFITSGYVLTSYTESYISAERVDNEQILFWRFAGGNDAVSHHPHSQCPVHMQGEQKTYIKFSCGWAIQTPPGYSCMFYQSPYFLEDRFSLFSGIVDTDTYDPEILFPGYVNAGIREIKIEAGTPLVTIFPFKRDSWDHEVMTEVVDWQKTGFARKKLRQIFDVYKTFCHQKKSYK